MALNYSLITQEPPTSLTATAVAGGSLDIGVTYYYKIYSWSASGGYFTISPQTAEVSATTDATNRSIQLDFTQTTSSAKRYTVLRTTTSGDYDSDDTHALRASSSPTPPAYWEDVSSITDDGSYGLTRSVNYPDGHPSIQINSDGTDTFTPEDLYQADVAGGWGVITKGIDKVNISSSNHDTRRYALAYVIDANINIATPTGTSNTFEMERETLVLYGSFIAANTSKINLNFGSKSTNRIDIGPAIINYPIHEFYRYDNGYGWWPNNFFYGNKNWYNFMFWNPQFYAANGSDYGPYRQVETHITGGTNTFELCTFMGTNQIRSGLGGNTFTHCSFQGLTVATATFNYCKFFSQYGIERGCLAYRLTSTATAIDSPTTMFGEADIYAGPCGTSERIHTIIDPLFQALGQTDNQPYFRLQYRGANSVNLKFDIQFRLGLTIQDKEGNAISGATVVIEDKDGNAISGSPFTTDDNGEITTQIITGRRLRLMWGEPTEWTYSSVSQGYEDDLVDTGDILERTYYTPHTITVSKSGYQTKTMKLTMDRKREQVVVLEKVLDYNLSRKARVLSQ